MNYSVGIEVMIFLRIFICSYCYNKIKHTIVGNISLQA